MYRAMEGHASWGRRAPGHTPETDCKHASSQLAGTWSPRKDYDQAVRPVWGGHAEVPHPVHGESKGEKFEDMLNTEAELEEANGLLAYRKSVREQLRTRVQTMEHAASVTWRALALAKVAALEREIDDLHDVELSTMQREQARVKRDAKIKATTTIQNNELKHDHQAVGSGEGEDGSVGAASERPGHQDDEQCSCCRDKSRKKG